MLLLILPQLIEKKNVWLMTWFLTSLFQGLYYPLYGAATCVAFLPMGIWQIVTYVKSGELYEDIKKVKFWIGWSVCIMLALLCTGLLLGTFKHMLAMSGQSILADGISRFGQLVPTWFFSYLGDEHPFFRLALYYTATFVTPAFLVWIAYAASIKTAEVSVVDRKIKIKDKKKFCMTISMVIMPIICYTYTIIRLDVDAIYARSTGVLYTVMVLILIFTWKYINNGSLRLFIIISAISIPAVVNGAGISAIASNDKLQAYYTVPENYMYVDSNPIEKIGTGFINVDTYNSICDVNNKFKNKDKNESYYGDPAWFGYYYLLNIKGDGAMEVSVTVRSYSAAQESVDIIRKNHSIVGNTFNPLYNYYFYHWLMASGEYYWDADMQEFIPNDGKFTKDEILEQNKNNGIINWNMDLGKTASSWGGSMNSLESLFEEKSVNYSLYDEENGINIDFEQCVDGNDADFLYLEFINMDENYNYTLFNYDGEVEQSKSVLAKYLMKKNYNPEMTVQIWWQDESGENHIMTCKMSRGKLLIPMGTGCKWLFNKHNSVSIHVYQDDTEIAVPQISNIRFLKLQEVQ